LTTSYRIHKHLAGKIAKSKYKYIHRNYQIWIYLRSLDNGGSFTIDKIVPELANMLNVSEYQVKYNILPHGQKIFWHDFTGNGKLFLIGKWKVFQYFEIEDNPGKVYLVPTHLFHKTKLQKIRSILWEISMGNRMMARYTQELVFERVPQTFINYSKIAEHKPISNFTKDSFVNMKTGEVGHRQLSNFYLEPFEKVQSSKRDKKYGWKTVGIPKRSLAVNHHKIYFDNHKELKRHLRMGWVKEGITVFVLRKFKTIHHINVDCNEWEAVDIPFRYNFFL